MRPTRLCPGLAFLLVAAGPLAAQAPAGAVRGSIRDEAGNPLTRATLVAVDIETGFRYASSTGDRGEYRLGGLPPGTYDLTASQIDVGAAVWRGLRLGVGQEVTVEFVLEHRPIELPPIEVVDARPPIETTRAEVSFRLDRNRIAALPEESRDFMDLAQLAPGATRFADPAEPVALTAVGALSPYYAGVLVDGASAIGSENNEILGAVPLAAIDGFEVMTAGYSAEHGQAASGVVSVVTRRGGNEFTAETFARYRHHSLNARGTFESVKPDFSRVHWGAALGGPIARDRTHVFAAFERREEDRFATIDTGGSFAALEGTFETPSRDNLWFARLDHRMDDAHELTLRYSGQHRSALTDVGSSSTCGIAQGGPLGSADYGAEIEGTSHSLLGVHRWRSASGRTVSETRLSFQRRAEDRTPVLAAPTLAYPTLCDGGNAFSWNQRSRRIEVRNDLSLSPGSSHRLKAGILAGFIDVNSPTGNFTNGAFAFSDDAAALPFQLQLALEGSGTIESTTQLGAYVQDEWRPTRHLTLDLGLRYDVETSSTNQDFVAPEAGLLPFVAESERPVDANNLAPRVGIAWDPAGDGHSVVRGGFGVFFHQSALAFAGLEASRNRIALVDDPGTTDLSTIPIDTMATLVVPNFLGRRFDTPATRQFSLGAEHAFEDGLVLSLDGILVEGRNLPVHRQLNAIVEIQVVGMDTVLVWRYPGSLLFQLLNEGEASGKMLVLRAHRQSETAWFDVSYTLADRKTTTDVWFDITPQADPDSEDFSGELGPAAWDERHRLVALGGVALGDGTGVTVKAVYASGRPFNVTTGGDENGDFFSNDRPAGVGRNSERGPDFFTLEMGVSQRFRIGDTTLRVGLNAYNLTNRDNFLPESVVGSQASGLFGEALAAGSKRQVELVVAAEF